MPLDAAHSAKAAPPKRKLQTYNAFQTAWRNNRKQLQEAFQHPVPVDLTLCDIRGLVGGFPGGTEVEDADHLSRVFY